MIPYILAAVGGYLIGDSLKGKQYAEGGMMARGGLTQSQEELLDEATATQELKEKARKKIKGSDAVLAVAYSDYGGTFGDKALIEFFKKNYPRNIVYEKAAYNGQNAILFGEPIKEYLDSPAILENFYMEMEMEVEEKEFKDFIIYLKDKKYKVSPNTLSWLLENRSGYYQTQPNGLDFNAEELENELIEEGLIKKAEDSLKGKQYADGGMMDIKIELFDIDYDTEDEDVRTIKSLKKNNLLPQVIETTAEKMGWDGDNLEEFIENNGADFISDETGFLVNSFNFEISK